MILSGAMLANPGVMHPADRVQFPTVFAATKVLFELGYPELFFADGISV